jgi:hypothetical protein
VIGCVIRSVSSSLGSVFVSDRSDVVWLCDFEPSVWRLTALRFRCSISILISCARSARSDNSFW